MKFFLGLIIGLLILPAIGYVYFRFGYAPVATASSPMPFEKKMASMALHARINKEAPKQVPIPVDEPNLTPGARIYVENCAFCHGLPNQKATIAAKGMSPLPPQLFNSEQMVTDDPPGVTYWKVSNGIRMTGMPGLTNIISPSLRAKYPETFTAKDTEFKELKANFDLADSRMNVKNLRMAAADFVVQGNGWADFDRKVDFRATLSFSQRLSADLSQSAREVKYLLNNQGQLEVPFALTGKMPNVKPKPDTRFLGQLVQRGFMRKGTEELQNRFLGGGKDSTAEKDEPPSDSGKKKKKNNTEDMIRRGLEGLFKR